MVSKMLSKEFKILSMVLIIGFMELEIELQDNQIESKEKLIQSMVLKTQWLETKTMLEQDVILAIFQFKVMILKIFVMK